MSFDARVSRVALFAGSCGLLAACASAGARPELPLPGGAARAAAPATPEQLGSVPGIARRRVVGYFMGTGVLRGVDPRKIRGDRLTHLIYAFADIGPDGLARLENPCIDVGQCAPGQRNPYPDGGVFAELRQLKQRYPHLKLLVSLGGWGRSGHFSDAAATPESRKAFIDSAMELFFRRYPGIFDGIDLDWEFPVRGGLPGNSYRPDDRANLTVLVEELRQRLDQDGAAAHRHYLLTEASPAGAGHMANQDLARMAASLDFFNIMCYDYHSGSRIAHFNAPLFSPVSDPTPTYNVDWTVRAYLALGIPAYKLVVGVPFYGVGYAGVPANRGLFQPVPRDSSAPPSPTAPAVAVAPAPATPYAARANRPWGAAGFRYHQLEEARQRGFKRYWHPEARAYWLHHPDTGVFVSYEDPRALKHKTDYIRRNDLGGLMFWEVGSDTTGTLLEAAWKGLRK